MVQTRARAYLLVSCGSSPLRQHGCNEHPRTNFDSCPNSGYRIRPAGWLFFQMALLDRRTSPPSRVGRYAGGWDEVCNSLDGFGCRRARRYEIGRPAWPMRHAACSQPGDRPVTRPPLAPSLPPAPAPREPQSPAPVPRILGRVARAMRPHMGGAWSTCSSRRTVGNSRDRPGAGQCLPHPARPRSPHARPDTWHR